MRVSIARPPVGKSARDSIVHPGLGAHYTRCRRRRSRSSSPRNVKKFSSYANGAEVSSFAFLRMLPRHLRPRQNSGRRKSMCDEFIHPGLIEDPRLSRRSFGAMTIAAAAVATTAHAQTNVVEKDVEVKTPDGTSDAVLFYPEGQGTSSAALIWTDILGLRPVFRDMGRRLAGEGHVVLVPNPFYRSARAPVVGATFD